MIKMEDENEESWKSVMNIEYEHEHEREVNKKSKTNMKTKCERLIKKNTEDKY